MATTTSPNEKQVLVDYNGETKEFHYNANQPEKGLLAEAVGQFHITSNQHVMALFTAAGAELEHEDEKLGKLGVKAGDELLLRPSKVKGG